MATKSPKLSTPHLKAVDLPDEPWSKLAVDIIGPVEQVSANCRFAITLIDYFSKWLEVNFTGHVTTSTVA